MHIYTIVVFMKQSNWDRHKINSVSRLLKVVYSSLLKLEVKTTRANGTDTQCGCSSCSLRLTSYHRTRKSQFPNLSPISNKYKSFSTAYVDQVRALSKGLIVLLQWGEMSKGKSKGQENVLSSLLSIQENERLVDLLGRRCVVSETV